jgi:rhamnose utilization protein RhaD (predicted bifunctional aldolase and dehydrogenase)
MVRDISQPDAGALKEAINELVALSRYFGSDTKFVIAGGGNTSLKIADRLFVKGSGVALATIGSDGFVEMKREALTDLIHKDLGSIPDEREARFKEAILAARLDPEKAQRPSVECVLHNMLPRRFVVHTHSTGANMLACSLKGEQLAGEILGEEILWIPYVDPGFALAQALKRSLGAYGARTGLDCPPAVLMQNHGLIVCGETTAEIIERTNWILNQIDTYLNSLAIQEPFGPIRKIEGEQARMLVDTFGPVLRSLLAEGDRLKVVTFDDSDVAMSLVGGEKGRIAAVSGPVLPEQIVYCLSYPLWFESIGNEAPEALILRLREALAQRREKTGNIPSIVLVKDLGLFAVGDDFAQSTAARLTYLDAIKVMSGAQKMGGIRILPDREREFIEHWEVESYRRGVAAAGGRRGQASGLVAVVIGAAQEFGLEVARCLGDDGAHVVICDESPDTARTHADAISARYGAGRGRAIGLDPTNIESISGALHAAVRAYGGYDVMVFDGGVLSSGNINAIRDPENDPIKMPDREDYPLILQRAGPVLALQREAKQDYCGNVVHIHSKSRLAGGSNCRNSLAGSQPGGTEAMPLFALELVEGSDIKVKSIFPSDSLFDSIGPDPEAGIFVQYLHHIKMPAVKMIGDARPFNESRIWVGNNCSAAAVAKAILYLIIQRFTAEHALGAAGH